MILIILLFSLVRLWTEYKSLRVNALSRKKVLDLHMVWMNHVKIVLDRILNINKSSICHLNKNYKLMII